MTLYIHPFIFCLATMIKRRSQREETKKSSKKALKKKQDWSEARRTKRSLRQARNSNFIEMKKQIGIPNLWFSIMTLFDIFIVRSCLFHSLRDLKSSGVLRVCWTIWISRNVEIKLKNPETFLIKSIYY